MENGMKQILTPLALSCSMLLTACSGDLFDADTGSSGGVQVASTSNHNVYVPAGMQNVAAGDAHLDGFVYGAGSNLGDASALESQASYQPLAESASDTAVTLSSRDLVAFIAEREARSLETDAESVLASIERSLENDVGGNANSIWKQQLGSSNEVVAAYIFTADTNTTATDVVNTLLGEMALGGESDDQELDNPAAALSTEVSTRSFEVYLGVLFAPRDAGVEGATDQVVMLGAVVPSQVAAAYSSLSSGVASTSNIGAKGTSPQNSSKEVKVADANSKADFLFVIDNSGSMSDDQATISSAANTFFSTVSGSGTDFKIATITTDSSTLRDENSDGGFTSSETEFKLDVKPGTGGSTTETGIFYAEQALQVNGESGATADGSVTTAGYPRTGASLSIIMFSDEPDFYNSISSGADFDASDNLFIDKNYQVYGIISPSSSEGRDNGYVDLINNTNGTYADISNLTALERIVEEIALQTAGASSLVKLDHAPIVVSIQVTVNGNSVAKSRTNGWQFNERLRTFSFYGTARLNAGDVVKVTYQYMPTSS